jgi:formamidopyrimidine-DNA glycosylase
MPELPDVTLYVERTAALFAGQPLEDICIASPFLLRSVEPPLAAARGRRLAGCRRLGKRIVWELEGELYLVFHLMIAGRFHLKPRLARPAARVGLAAFDFPTATLALTEASTKKRASLLLVSGGQALAALAREGIEIETASLETFTAAMFK